MSGKCNRVGRINSVGGTEWEEQNRMGTSKTSNEEVEDWRTEERKGEEWRKESGGVWCKGERSREEVKQVLQKKCKEIKGRVCSNE